MNILMQEILVFRNTYSFGQHKKLAYYIHMGINSVSIYRRICRRIPYFKDTEDLMLLCADEYKVDSVRSVELSFDALHRLSDVVLGKEWSCFSPESQRFHSGRITIPGICGEQLLMTELQQDIQRYRTSEHKRRLLEKYGRKVEESSLLKKPFILNSLNENTYAKDLIDNLLKLQKIFFLTGIEYPIPGAFLLFPSKDLAYWIDRLSLICKDIHIEETYNI
jgi:hypothetical protein